MTVQHFPSPYERLLKTMQNVFLVSEPKHSNKRWSQARTNFPVIPFSNTLPTFCTVFSLHPIGTPVGFLLKMCVDSDRNVISSYFATVIGM